MSSPRAGATVSTVESRTGSALELVAALATRLMRVPAAAVAVRRPDGWINFCAGLSAVWRHRELPGCRPALESPDIVSGPVLDSLRPAPGCAVCTVAPVWNPDVRAAILIYDRRSRKLAPQGLQTLGNLRSVVADLLRNSSEIFEQEEAWFTLDLAGRFTSVNGALESAGYTDHNLLGAHLSDLVPSGKRQEFEERLLEQLGGANGGLDVPLETKQGGRETLTFRTRLLFERGRPAGLQALRPGLRRVSESCTDARTSELARLSESLRELQRLSRSAPTSLAELCRAYLSRGCSIFGACWGCVEAGPLVETWPEGVRNAESEPLVSATLIAGGRALGKLSFSGPLAQFDVGGIQGDILELMAMAIAHAIEADELRRERDDLNVNLADQLRRDGLTGLPNRMAAVDRVAEMQPDGLAIAFLDIDRFKQVNDTLGHGAGDELLIQFGRRLESCIETGELAARLGGDEFMVALKPFDARQVGRRMKQLLDGLRAPYAVNGYELFLTASIGIAVSSPGESAAFDQLLQRADAAMFRAKTSGKNSYEIFSPDMAARTADRLELETQLWRALEHGEFEMRFQPIFGISGQLDSLEVLLSWDNPKFGRVGPAQFIPIAEETGMIFEIGEWVLRQACLQKTRWVSEGLVPPRISVNVSALQFARADFVDAVARVLSETGVPPQCLELELTESLVMRDAEEAVARMRSLREIGVLITIDDFGTGYSSLNYLHSLPADVLKVDRSFSADLLSARSTLPVVQTIVELAHSLGLSVVVEGVETREQLELLKQIGCDKVQGHLFGAPLRVEQVRPLLRRAAHA